MVGFAFVRSDGLTQFPHLIHGLPPVHPFGPNHFQRWFNREIRDFFLQPSQTHRPELLAIQQVKPLVCRCGGDSGFFRCPSLGGGLCLRPRSFPSRGPPDFLLGFRLRSRFRLDRGFRLGENNPCLFLCPQLRGGFHLGRHSEVGDFHGLNGSSCKGAAFDRIPPIPCADRGKEMLPEIHLNRCGLGWLRWRPVRQSLSRDVLRIAENQENEIILRAQYRPTAPKTGRSSTDLEIGCRTLAHVKRGHVCYLGPTTSS